MAGTSGTADDGFLGRAVEIAIAAHRGQAYPSPESEPFIEHPLRVMGAVDGPLAKAAAVLHDVLEDTDVTVGALRDAGMPGEVVDAVIALTHVPALSYDAYIEHVAQNALAREVKLADLRENVANNRRLAPTPDVLERIGRYERSIERLASVDPSPGIASVAVRSALVADAPIVAELLSYLGYTARPDQAAERLAALDASSTVLIADGGLIALTRIPLLAEGGALARITALVVAPNARGRGVARALLAAAEAVAVGWGCTRLEVSCGLRAERDAAHAFYRAAGFEDSRAMSARYWKQLAAVNRPTR
jgi:GNAT superfamily N-acetyltransferase